MSNFSFFETSSAETSYVDSVKGITTFTNSGSEQWNPSKNTVQVAGAHGTSNNSVSAGGSYEVKFDSEDQAGSYGEHGVTNGGNAGISVSIRNAAELLLVFKDGVAVKWGSKYIGDDGILHLTYSFFPTGENLPEYYSDLKSKIQDSIGVQGTPYGYKWMEDRKVEIFTDEQQEAVRKVLEMFEEYIGVSFKKVSSGGDLLFANSTETVSSWNNLRYEEFFVYGPPGYVNSDVAGDIWFAAHDKLEESWEPGSENYAALIYAIGGALGLQDASVLDSQYPGLNKQLYTTMSYPEESSWLSSKTYAASLMPLDIVALQSLYGYPEDSSHQLPSPSNSYSSYLYSFWHPDISWIQLLYGTEDWTVNIQNQNTGLNDSTEPGIQSSDGKLIWNLGQTVSVWLGSGDDTINASVYYVSYNGFTTLDGGAGDDTYYFHTGWNKDAKYVVADASGKDVIKTTTSFEQAQLLMNGDLELIWPSGGGVTIENYEDNQIEKLVNGDYTVDLVSIVDSLGEFGISWL